MMFTWILWHMAPNTICTIGNTTKFSGIIKNMGIDPPGTNLFGEVCGCEIIFDN